MLPSREFANVYIKDEGLNPTDHQGARASAAVTMAKAYGLKKLQSFRRQCCQCHGRIRRQCRIEAHIFMPKDVPLAIE